LLTPTRIYVKAIRKLTAAADVKAISHITGGGFYENIPRMLKDGIHADIEKAAAPVPAVFDVISKAGNIPERDMYNTFNMGVGLVVAVAKGDADKALAALAEAGEKAYIIGQASAGEKGITLK